MKNIQWLLSLILLIGMVSCKPKDTEPTPDGKEVAFEVSATEYDRLIAARTTQTRHFEIKDIKRESDILKIWVKGGCDKSNYKVVWDGIMRKSYPLTVFLVVTLEQGTGIECAAELDHLLEIDLKEKFGTLYETDELHILLSNGSKIFDKVIDPAGAVTNK
ncbi:hypothetical protein [Emticicia agri]|uniref:Lipoprotein n=1 Tax=Emticicia agri TaxID=2492393 RepID=A0A4Q5M0B6_9BACT|nr:hypothetical protein [Emticicia agri]RYU95641.1 hypothetical protein EWM59_11045 [Emticicia agri]